MTDIVELLRRERATDPLAIEAADTIQGMLEKGMDNLTLLAAFQVNEELSAEIERLRAENATLRTKLEARETRDPADFV